MKKVITSKTAPAPIGPYSRAVQAGNFVYLSGAIALKADGSLEQSSIEAETRQVLENMRTVLQDTGLGFEHLVKTSIFLTDMKDFAEVNKIYAAYFSSDFPARETVQVAALPAGARVEISGVAYIA